MIELVHLSAKPNASKRTKNRLREHEGPFLSGYLPIEANVIPGKGDCMHFTCHCHLNTERYWFGWFPLSEITINKVDFH